MGKYIECDEYGLCAFCQKGKGNTPIVDSETLRELWICENCDNLIEWETDKAKANIVTENLIPKP